MNELVSTLDKITQGPVCGATGCTSAPLAQWQRRLTPDELATEIAIIQARWDAAFLLWDQSQPDPIQPPLPDGTDYTRAIYACGAHALSLVAAAHTHQSTCSGPNSPNLPRCDCTPEPLPTPAAAVAASTPTVPEHWAAAMAGSD